MCWTKKCDTDDTDDTNDADDARRLKWYLYVATHFVCRRHNKIISLSPYVKIVYLLFTIRYVNTYTRCIFSIHDAIPFSIYVNKWFLFIWFKYFCSYSVFLPTIERLQKTNKKVSINISHGITLCNNYDSKPIISINQNFTVSVSFVTIKFHISVVLFMI